MIRGLGDRDTNTLRKEAAGSLHTAEYGTRGERNHCLDPGIWRCCTPLSTPGPPQKLRAGPKNVQQVMQPLALGTCKHCKPLR